MQNTLLSLLQALQLAALGPCLFIVAFLLLTVRRPAAVIIPCLYFLSLAASFILPLIPVLQPLPSDVTLGTLLFTESLTPALSFLLILQFIHGRPPTLPFWLVLTIPAIGGASFIYGVLNFEEVCLRQSYCLPATSLKTLYQLLSSALIFLLLIAYFSRQHGGHHANATRSRHQYWLIIALVALSLFLMSVDLAYITGHIGAQQSDYVVTLIRISFIYLVLTSLFRVFDRTVEVDTGRIPTLTHSRRKPTDDWMLEKIERAVKRDYAYRDCGTLESFSEKLVIPEHQISRVINAHYGMSFSDFINEQRIEEAKQRLAGETTPITSIAMEVGFGSIASFNRVFKEKTGMTPTAYRKNHHDIL